MMRKVIFTNTSLNQFEDWIRINPRKASKILRLIKEIFKNPYSGTGKPEPLKYELNNFWSRRIDQEHRLVNKVENDQITIISCRYHY